MLADADAELLRRHVELFNVGVRSGDFGPMLEQFADDAELVFEGVPVGPFRGADAITVAYREQPPDDELEVLGASRDGGDIVARYAWRRQPGVRAGEMRLTPAGDRIRRLVVAFA
ncbi:MAG: nuclear transport factor 2 family protein [Actinomycetota bacterium]|nr:nuclear transport factor 2 family protein [Actinomycetota bacterium]